MKKILASVATIIAMSASSAAVADQNVRLILKKKTSPFAVAMQKSLPGNAAYEYTAHTVDTSVQNEQEVIGALLATGEYESVEADLPVVFYGESSSLPNDEMLMEQWYFFRDPQITDFDGSLIMEAKQKAVYNKRLRVAVVDGEFGDGSPGEHDDVPFVGGYRFTVNGEGLYEPNYLESSDYTTTCERNNFGHGLAIASLIGSTSNNSIGLSGMLDADLLAIKTLDCAGGGMWDIAQALLWLSGGKPVNEVITETESGGYVINEQEIEPISEIADLINISIGTSPGEYTECPQYMQEAINFAVARGLTIVVAAGNESSGENQSVPANCKNIVVAGASEKNGEMARWSNTGDQVDLVAPGVEIIGANLLNDFSIWNGTSFATPITLGALGYAKSEFPQLVTHELKKLLNESLTPFPERRSPWYSCSNQDGWCGKGILNASALIDAARDYMNSDRHFIRHALNTGEVCDDALYADLFGESKRLCSLVEVSFDSSIAVNEGAIYELYRVDAAKTFSDANAMHIMSAQEPVFMMSDLDIDDGQYGYKTCLNGVCSGNMIRMNTQNAQKPSNCL